MPPPSSPVPRLSSIPSAASTVHALARSSLPSSSAVPVILRPDLVRSLSSVRTSVFLFLVPRSSLSFLPTDCQSNASRSLSHQLTPSPGLEGFNPSGSGLDTIATTSTPTSNRDGADLCPTFCQPLPPRLVGGEGRADHQPGRATPSRSPCRPSPPCRGMPWHKAVKFCLSSENQGHSSVAAGRFQEKGISPKNFLNLSNS